MNWDYSRLAKQRIYLFPLSKNFFNLVIIFSVSVFLLGASFLPYTQHSFFYQKTTSDRQNKGLPTYICKKISQKIEVDGRLNDPSWEKADVIALQDAVTGKSGRFRTEVRGLYDDQYLYFGFYCEDDHIWGTVTERDGPIWNEECVEVFLNPAGVMHQYYEINVSPKNIIYDSVILNNRTPNSPFGKFIGFPEWNVEGLRTAVSTDGKTDEFDTSEGWTAEFAIPHNVLFGAPNHPPQSDDVWQVNFYRIDSPKEGNRDHYAWSTTGREAFHLPWRFGILTFE